MQIRLGASIDAGRLTNRLLGESVIGERAERSMDAPRPVGCLPRPPSLPSAPTQTLGSYMGLVDNKAHAGIFHARFSPD